MKTYTNLLKTQSRWLCAIAIGAVIAVGFASCGGKKDSGGGGGGSARASAPAVKGSGKNYTLSKAEDFKYELTNIDGTDYVVILGVNVPSGFNWGDEDDRMEGVLVDTLTVNIPEKIEGYTVGAVGKKGSFSDLVGGPTFSMKTLVAVTIPDTVVQINGKGFRSAGISSIKLPKNLKELGEYVFGGCEKLSGSLVIPEGVTEIPDYCFTGTSITEVTIPESVTAIGYRAFYNCKELATVKLPSHPIKYGNNNGKDVFNDCGKLSLAVRKAIEESGYTGGF